MKDVVQLQLDDTMESRTFKHHPEIMKADCSKLAGGVKKSC